MDKINRQLIKAGLYYLTDKDKESFIDRLSLYLQERSELMNFLFDGPLPINEEVKQKLEEYIKSVLPSPEYFKEIVEMGIDFDYNLLDFMMQGIYLGMGKECLMILILYQ